MEISALWRRGVVTGVAATLAIAVSAVPAAAAAPSPTISPVGRLITHTNQPSAQQERSTVAPSAVGHVLALAVETKYPSGVPAFTASGVAGGGVTTWTRATRLVSADGVHDLEIWWGAVTAAGSSTVTVSYGAGSTSGNAQSATSLDVQEFASSAGTSTVWSADGTGHVDLGAATTAPRYPTLTPAAGTDAYFGYLIVTGSVAPGSTAGVTYQADARGNQIGYATAVSAALGPKAKASPATTFSSLAMLLHPTDGGSTTTTTTAPTTTPTTPPTSTTTAPTSTPTSTTAPPTHRTITAVGTLASHTNQPAKAQESVTVSPRAVGDVLILAVETKYPGTPAFAATGISGGGVTTWTRAMAYPTLDGFHGQELWWGVVTSSGSGKTVTAAFGAGVTQGTSESASSLDVQELQSSGGAATVWSVDGTGKVDTGATSTAPAYPTLTPSAGTDAYVGYLAVPGAVGPGSTPGVVYQTDARGNQVAYAVAVSSTITPKASSSAQTFSSSGMLLTAT